MYPKQVSDIREKPTNGGSRLVIKCEESLFPFLADFWPERVTLRCLEGQIYYTIYNPVFVFTTVIGHHIHVLRMIPLRPTKTQSPCVPRRFWGALR